MDQSLAFFITIAFEAPIIGLTFYRLKLSLLRIIALCIIPTLITHPLLWQSLVNLPIAINYKWAVLIGEIMVMMIEAIVIRYLSAASWYLSLSVSIFVNILSWILGSLVFSCLRS